MSTETELLILQDIAKTAKFLMVKAQNTIEHPGFEDSNLDDMMGSVVELDFLVSKYDGVLSVKR